MGEAMTTNQTIDGVLVSRELLERFVSDVEAHCYGFDGLEELRALLDAPVNPLSEIEVLRAAVKELEVMRDARVDSKLAQGDSVTIEAVAVTREKVDGSLRLEWLLEGGIAQMESAGMVLFAIPEANDLCDEDGSAEVYLTPPQVEQPAPVADLLEQLEQLKAENKQMIQAATSRLMGRLAPVAGAPICCGSCPGGCVTHQSIK